MKLKAVAFAATIGLGAMVIWLTIVHFLNRANMPPLAGRAEVYKFYRLEFLEDGFPGRRTDYGLIPHPIYGTYVIGDYIRQFQVTRDPIFLEAAKKVADAAINRMETLPGGSLVFYYDPESGLTALKRHYSGLTQARYLSAFSSLWLESKNKVYLEAAEKVLTSLTVPVSGGGVSLSARGGLVIEEWPDEIGGNYTLNGWTTAMLIVHDYYARTGSSAAKWLFDQNVIALKALLPLYDVPELANTRYRLSGSARIRFIGIHRDQIKEAKVGVPGVGAAEIHSEGKGKWENYFLPAQHPDIIDMHAVLNMISAPEPNTLDLTIEVKKAGEMEIEIGQGFFNPSTVDLPVKSYLSLGKMKLSLGENRISVKVPWHSAQLVAYPTAFNKKIGGKTYNVYHYIHVKNISKLASLTAEPVFAEYARKWDGYTREWKRIPLYNSLRISLSPVP